LKSKEKELKNATKLIEILKKDKEALFNNLNERSDYKQVVEFEDKLKLIEKKNKELILEVDTLKKWQKSILFVLKIKAILKKTKLL